MSAVDRQRLVGIVKDAQYDGAPHHQFPHVFTEEHLDGQLGAKTGSYENSSHTV
jgi:hypothetical protein